MYIHDSHMDCYTTFIQLVTSCEKYYTCQNSKCQNKHFGLLNIVIVYAMGAENSILSNVEWGEKYNYTSHEWTIENGELENGIEISMFSVVKKESKYRELLRKLAKVSSLAIHKLVVLMVPRSIFMFLTEDTTINIGAQYRRHQTYSDALKNSFFP